VIVFFATWCQMCEQKMPELRGALDALGPVTVIGVSVDDPDTWSRVPAFMQTHGLRFPLVRASQYPRFALSYNPFSMVPLVVVVGRNGGLVDFQMGYAPNDRERLIAAVQLARNIGPLADPHGHPEREAHPPSGF
jgi:peroxiredoxin